MKTHPFSDHSFAEFLAARRFMGSRCLSCSVHFVPPRCYCPKCRSWEMEWTEMKGTGRLVAATCISVPPPALEEEGYGRTNPCCTGVVQLDENVRVVARIEGVNTQDPKSISTGMPVEIVFHDAKAVSSAKSVVTFRPRSMPDERENR